MQYTIKSIGFLLFMLFANNILAQGHGSVRSKPSDVATDGNSRTTASDSAAQQNKNGTKPNFKRWYTGGNFGLSFLNGGFAGNLSPLVGYRLTPKFSVGGGIILTGVSLANVGSSSTGRAVPAFFGQYGGRVFSRYVLFNGVFAHTEFEQAFNAYPDYIQNDKVVYRTVPLPSALAGLGVNLGAGRINLNVTALYNFLYNVYSPDQLVANQNSFTDYRFGGLVLRGGIGIGF